ncbi:hypothetical protein Hamer_G018109 [Homarus americanus]|uniref:Uncharacterized protein n=1 Tax=Homarus americanus TaxID=6706 RepID=A0A8J5N678_HOMAM|nr:hypothetical protein Hamer_G018109 [Homarus americanus]
MTEVGEGYTFFKRGGPEDTRREYGVGFAVKTSLLRNSPETPAGINKRLMTWRISLVKGRNVTIFSAYAPTLDANEETNDRFSGLSLCYHLQRLMHPKLVTLLWSRYVTIFSA